MPTPQNRDDGLRDELRAIGQSLQSNGQNIANRLDEIDRKQTAQAITFQASLAELRRELMGMFVAKQEYDPKHAILVDKIVKIDKVLEERQAMVQEYYTVKAHVEQNALDIEDLQKHNSGMIGRVVSIGALALSAISLMLNFLQHVQIK